MKACIKCREIKFWFQFHSEFMGYFTFTYDVCKKCANKLKDEAVRELQYKFNKSIK